MLSPRKNRNYDRDTYDINRAVEHLSRYNQNNYDIERAARALEKKKSQG